MKTVQEEVASVYEVQMAKGVFLEVVKENAGYIELPQDHPLYMSPNILMSCALARVWMAAKAYQRDQEAHRE